MRKALVRFRISSHQLRIETGRYENIPPNERICHFCTSNKIEDENHFWLDCKAYSQIRDIFFSKLETKIPDFKSLSHDTLISLLMNYSDYLRATPFKYRPKCSKAQKIKIALLLHSDRLK